MGMRKKWKFGAAARKVRGIPRYRHRAVLTGKRTANGTGRYKVWRLLKSRDRVALPRGCKLAALGARLGMPT